MEKETLEEVALRIYQYVSENPPYTTITPKDKIEGFIEGAKWQQEQDLNWFNEYQKVEDYIIEKIGDEFLKATPEKHKTASQSTIALLENKWQAERMYSEEDFKLFARQFYREIKLDKSNLLWDELADKCFEQFKKK